MGNEKHDDFGRLLCTIELIGVKIWTVSRSVSNRSKGGGAGRCPIQVFQFCFLATKYKSYPLVVALLVSLHRKTNRAR